MKYTLQRLQADVMARLGELARPRGDGGGSGVPWPEDVISVKAGAMLAAEGGRLIKETGTEQLGGGVGGLCSEIGMRLMPSGLYGMELRLPEGFLRVASVKMSEWRGSVSTVIGPEHSDWRRQWSIHPGMAGCPEWPRAYLDRDEGGLLLRLSGSTSADDSVEWTGVWCMPSVDASGMFDFPEGLYPELVGRIVLSLES